jgi:hypothetical protein
MTRPGLIMKLPGAVAYFASRPQTKSAAKNDSPVGGKQLKSCIKISGIASRAVLARISASLCGTLLSCRIHILTASLWEIFLGGADKELLCWEFFGRR